MIIAIDGPAASGKSTTAKAVAKELGINYIDTGAMYRACALKLLKMGIELTDSLLLQEVVGALRISFADNGQTVFLDDVDVSSSIRDDVVSQGASQIATIGFVRQRMTELQRDMGNKESVVMDGRDIGSAVFPKADFKFYLVASVQTRAERRFLEAKAKGESLSLEEIKASIAARDKADMGREISPLIKADDAIEIDTSGLSIEQQVAKVLEVVHRLSYL